MSLLERRPPQRGYVHLAGPDDSALEYITFGTLSLGEGEQHSMAHAGRETLLVILGGRCDVAVVGQTWSGIGSRADVFDGKPTAVYVPPDTECQVTGCGSVEIAVCSAAAEPGPEPTLIAPEDVGVREVGTGTFHRVIYDIVSAESLPAKRLLVGETYNPPGLWSSYPPHKHDEHRPPEESKLEEVYHFRVKPPQGFGIQRVYGEGFDETYAVRDRDTVVICRGYHPVAAAPGYQLYYLWMLAGRERVMRPREDPDHAWVAAQG